MQRLHIIQISDLDLTPRGQLSVHHQQLDPWHKLATIIQDIRTLPVQPDLIVLTGDLIHGGSATDYQRLHVVVHQMKAEFQCHVRVILGNHDNREAFYAGYLPANPGPYYTSRMRIGRNDFYFLDSKVTGFEAGELALKQLQWLGKHLRQAPTKRAFLFLHHPLDGPTMQNMHYAILQNTSALLSVLRGHNIGGVFTGHVHFATTYLVGDRILNAVAEPAAYRIDCTDPQMHLVHESSGYQVITVERGQVGVATRQLLYRPAVIDTIRIANARFLVPSPLTSRIC
ncbi:3',5'-cyclic-nucleotide phosphodiesterase [Lactobacillus sp. CBA3605]|uniref:metallophosphoesterase n=1 Tax=Lactobacillus sp. CBA3605 TaxID=2099788 RepID=UPI000CFBBCAE|nr:metallophosphoesterase [Lactobacillus sp. CBA3605]AVK61289.1 3',5'-cyclic-nucleotide phosphodiesterase [Lactobacillus sp. CBA3605]